MKQVAKANQGDITLAQPEIKKKGKTKKNQFDIPIAPALKALTGVDLCRIPGISEVSALEVISETGINTKKWKGIKLFFCMAKCSSKY